MSNTEFPEIPNIENEQIREKLQAAYALNLCTVSVSQIVDYDDAIILDQEYETILNNLNLENMPKDEALLDILRRLLETIAFFKIQEREKLIVEQEYQQTMKNAIWSAVPNLAILFSGGNLFSLLATVTVQAGIGYMNYRKARSQCDLEKERQKWGLQKAAMEQLESLQQQLFVTAWRLADTYDFPDEFRLTQRQIRQYDAILMDADEIRKYERMDSIKDKFVAYPPFWYYFGNTANSIANRPNLNDKEKTIYREKAKKYFEYYRECNKYNLLREDTIAASCNLEYATLLDPGKEKEKIKALIDSAVKYTDNSWDVLQLCAFNYLRIQEISPAVSIMKRLVNEEYNADSNAQILSRIYVEKIIKEESHEARANYKLLKDRIGAKYLFPLPAYWEKTEAVEAKFINAQRMIVNEKYKFILNEFIQKYTIRINEIFPLPVYEKDSEFYLGKAKKERYYQFAKLLSDREFCNNFNSYVHSITYSQEVLGILSDMFNAICTLDCVKEKSTVDELAKIIETKIKENKEKIIAVDKAIESEEENIIDIYQKSQEVILKDFAEEFFGSLRKVVQTYLDGKKEMKDFVAVETELMDFCNRESIQMPKLHSGQNELGGKEERLEKRRFDEDLLKG